MIIFQHNVSNITGNFIRKSLYHQVMLPELEGSSCTVAFVGQIRLSSTLSD